MKHYVHTHVLPLPPRRLMELLDEEAYRDFMLANMPDLVAAERLELRWEGEKRIKRSRMQFDPPLPTLIKRALPSRGRGWVEEYSVLDFKEFRMDCTYKSSASETHRITYFKKGPKPDHTERVVEGNFRGTLPLVSGPLERFMEKEIEKHKDTEYEMTMRFLREHMGIKS